jgi:hypothetical protein
VAVHTEETGGATGWCLDPHDLILSKYVPFREKDEAFILEVVHHRLVRRERLLALLATMPVDAAVRQRIEAQIRMPR